MALTSLLVCADAEAVQVLGGILQDLGIEVEFCGDLGLAQTCIAQRPFDAILVDCLHEPAAVNLMAQIRSSSINPASAVIALVDSQNRLREVFASGANFVLYKPISKERADPSLRAACSLIRRERRQQPRILVEAGSSLAYPSKEDGSARLLDLNELGLKAHTEEKLPPSCKVYFQFALPGDKSVIRLSGEVMWRDASGRVGIRFAQMPASSRKVLQTWVQLNFSKDTQGSTAGASSDLLKLGLRADLGTLATPASERRDLTRHPCRLGVDVFRAENPAPVRCTLTDVGTGGCYVETADTLAEGTAVQIVVRNQRQKLAIPGKVKNVDRGFGMGVEFRPRNADQKKQLEEWLVSLQAEAPGIG